MDRWTHSSLACGSTLSDDHEEDGHKIERPPLPSSSSSLCDDEKWHK
jgi:hypothetical protein